MPSGAVLFDQPDPAIVRRFDLVWKRGEWIRTRTPHAPMPWILLE
jgi:hypothetical protein